MSTFFVTLAPPPAAVVEGPPPEDTAAGASAPGARPAPSVDRLPSCLVAPPKAGHDSAVWRSVLLKPDAELGADGEAVQARRNRRSMSVISLPRALALTNALRVRPSFPPPAFHDAGESELLENASKEAHVDVESDAIPLENSDSARTEFEDAPDQDHAPRRTRLSSRAPKVAKPLEDVLEGATGVIG